MPAVITTINKLKKLDNFRLGVVFGMAIGIILFAILMILTQGHFLYNDWLFLFFVPQFIGRTTSGCSYISRTFDGLQTDENTFNSQIPIPVRTLFNWRKNTPGGETNGAVADRPAIKYERWGIYSGVIIAITASVATFALGDTVPLANTLGFFAYPLLFLGNIGLFAGLGHRTGSIFSPNRLKSEKLALGLGFIIGITMGISLAAYGVAGDIFVLGVSTFLTGGFGFPAIAGIVFAIMLTSNWLSFFDYFAKALLFVCYCGDINKPDLNSNRGNNNSNDAKIKVARNRYEFGFTLIGIILALAISIAIIFLVVPLPILATLTVIGAILAILKEIMIVVTIVGVVGAIFSRIGRLIQKFTDIPKGEPKKTLEIENTHNAINTQLNNTRTSSPVLTLTPTQTQLDQSESTTSGCFSCLFGKSKTASAPTKAPDQFPKSIF
jgi:hypothetical protein